MNADMLVLTYIGGLCALALVLAPLFLLLQIARDVRKIRESARVAEIYFRASIEERARQ